MSKLGSIFSSNEWASVSKEFSEGFEIESADMNYMRMMITFQYADIVSTLKNYTIEGYQDYLVLYKRNSKVDIVDMDNVYDDGRELLDIIINDHSNELV